jgi:hypothetical protein
MKRIAENGLSLVVLTAMPRSRYAQPKVLTGLARLEEAYDVTGYRLYWLPAFCESQRPALFANEPDVMGNVRYLDLQHFLERD